MKQRVLSAFRVSAKNTSRGDSGRIRTQQYLLQYRILASLASYGKLGGREVRTSALESRRSMGSSPPRVACEGLLFLQTFEKHRAYSALYTNMSVQGKKLKSIVYIPNARISSIDDLPGEEFREVRSSDE